MASATLEAKALRVNDARVARYANQRKRGILELLEGYRDELAAEALAELRSGKLRLQKSAPKFEKELAELLILFGLRQANAAGKVTADALGGDWKIPPALVRRITEGKDVLVQNIREDIEDEVREIIRALMLDAQQAVPQPTIAQMSRAMQTELSDLVAVNSTRAALIARTESVQTESVGIATGMEIAGIEEIEWLSSRNPNHGDRRHDKLHGKTVKLGEYFTNPTTGRKLRYPGDPSAHISETANCGCTYAPVKKKPRKRAA